MSRVKDAIDRQREWEAKDGFRTKIITGPEAQEIPTQEPILFACPVCGKLHDTQERAEACRDQPFNEAGVKVGDIFVVPAECLYDTEVVPGYEHWIAFGTDPEPKSSSHFDHHHKLYPYFVATAIQQDNPDCHRALVTLCTLARGGLAHGWNPADGDGHHDMFAPGRHYKGQKTHTNGQYWWQRESYQSMSVGDRIEICQPSEKLLADAAELAAIGIRSRSLL